MIFLVSSTKYKTNRSIQTISSNTKGEFRGLSCNICVSFFTYAGNELIQSIAAFGIGESCSELCELLSDEINKDICEVLCFIAGIEEFENLLIGADLDPIYLCSVLDICPLNKCTGPCTTITSIIVSPLAAPIGTIFNVQVNLQVNKPTGTGVTRILVIPPPPSQEFGYQSLNTGFEPGHFQLNVSLSTESIGNYPNGFYNLLIESCGSDCDNEHGTYFSKATSNLTLTK